MEIFANYHKERDAFLSLTEPDCKKRILLLSGGSGAGKTSLLRSCRGDVCDPVCYLPIQLRGSAVGISEFFWRTGDCLGWDSLPRFTNQLSDLGGISVNIAKNKIKGSDNQIRVVLQEGNPETRKEHRTFMTGALFEDLQNLDQLLLIAMDTYEQATDEIKDWISGPFLSRTAKNANVRVAISGQEVPDANTIEWDYCCKEFELFGVKEVKHWMPVVNAMGRILPDEQWLAGVCFALDGNPALIRQTIERLPLSHD